MLLQYKKEDTTFIDYQKIEALTEEEFEYVGKKYRNAYIKKYRDKKAIEIKEMKEKLKKYEEGEK